MHTVTREILLKRIALKLIKLELEYYTVNSILYDDTYFKAYCSLQDLKEEDAT